MPAKDNPYPASHLGEYLDLKTVGQIHTQFTQIIQKLQEEYAVLPQRPALFIDYLYEKMIVHQSLEYSRIDDLQYLRIVKLYNFLSSPTLLDHINISSWSDNEREKIITTLNEMTLEFLSKDFSSQAISSIQSTNKGVNVLGQKNTSGANSSYADDRILIQDKVCTLESKFLKEFLTRKASNIHAKISSVTQVEPSYRVMVLDVKLDLSSKSLFELIKTKFVITGNKSDILAKHHRDLIASQNRLLLLLGEVYQKYQESQESSKDSEQTSRESDHEIDHGPEQVNPFVDSGFDPTTLDSMQSYKAMIDGLNQEITDQKAAYEAELKAREAERDELQEALRNAKASNEDETRASAAIRQQLDRAEAEVAGVQAILEENGRMRAQIQGYQERQAELVAALSDQSDLNQKVKKLEKSNHDQAQILAKREEDHNAFSKRVIFNLFEVVGDSRFAQDELAPSIGPSFTNSATEDLPKLDHLFNLVKAKFSAAEQVLQQEVTDRAKLNANTKAVLANQDAAMAELEKIFNAFSSENIESPQFQQAKTNIEELDNEIARVKQQISNTDHAISTFTPTLDVGSEEEHSQLHQLKAKLADLHARYAALVKQKFSQMLTTLEHNFQQIIGHSQEEHQAILRLQAEQTKSSLELASLKVELQRSQAKIGELVTQNQKLAAAYNDLSAEMTVLSEEIAQIKDQNTELHAQVDRATESLARAQSELERFNAKEAEYQQRIDAKETEITGLKQQLKSRQSEIEQRDSDITTLSREHQASQDKLQKKLSRAEQLLGSLQQQQGANQSMVVEFSQKVEKLTRALEDKSQQLNAATRAHKLAVEELADKNAQLQNMQHIIAENTTLRQNLANSEESLQQNQAKVAAAAAELSRQQEQIGALRQELAKLEETSTQEATELTTEIADLKTRLSGKEIELKRENEVNKAQAQRLQDLQQQITELEQLLTHPPQENSTLKDELSAKITTLENIIAVQQEQLKSKDQAQSKLSLKLNELRKILKESQQKNLKDQLESALKNIDLQNLKTQLEEVNKELIAANSQLHQELTEITAEKAALTANLQHKTAELAKVRQNFEANNLALNTQLLAAHQNNERLQSDLATLHQANQAQQAQIDTLKSKLAEQEEANVALLAEKSRLVAKNTELLEQYNQIKAQLSLAISQNQSLTTEKAQLNTELTSVKEQLKRLESQYHTEYAKLQQQISTLDQAQQVEQTTHIESMAKLQEKIAELEEIIQRKNLAEATIATNLASLEQALAKMTTETTAQTKSFSENIAALKAQLEQQTSLTAALELDKVTLTQALKESTDTIKNLQIQIAQLNFTLEEVTARHQLELEMMDDLLDLNVAAKQDLQQYIATQRQQLLTQEEKLLEQDLALTNLKNNNQGLLAQNDVVIATLKQKITEISQQLEDNQAKLQAAQREHQDEISSLQQANIELAREKESLEQQISQLTQSNLKLRDENSKLNEVMQQNEELKVKLQLLQQQQQETVIELKKTQGLLEENQALLENVETQLRLKDISLRSQQAELAHLAAGRERDDAVITAQQAQVDALGQGIAANTAELTTLRADNTRLNQELSRLQGEYEGKIEEINQFRLSLDAATSQNEQLLTEISNLKNRLSENEKKLAQLSEEKTLLQDQAGDVKVQIDGIGLHIAQLEQENADLHDQLNHKSKAYDEIKTQNSQQDGIIKNLLAEVTQLKEKLGEKTQHLSESLERIKTLLTELEQTKDEVKLNQEAYAALLSRNGDELQEYENKIRDEIMAMQDLDFSYLSHDFKSKQEISRLNAQIAQNLNQIKELTDQSEIVNAQVKQQLAAIQELTDITAADKTKLLAQSHEITALSEGKSQANLELEQLRSAQAALQKKYDVLRDNLQDLNQSQLSLKREIENISAERDQLSAIVSTQKQELATERDNLKIRSDQLELVQQKLTQINAQAAAATAIHADELELNKSQLRVLEEQKADLTRQVESYEQIIAAKERALVQQTEQLEAKAAEIGRQESQLVQQEDKLANLAKEYEVYKVGVEEFVKIKNELALKLILDLEEDERQQLNQLKDEEFDNLILPHAKDVITLLQRLEQQNKRLAEYQVFNHQLAAAVTAHKAVTTQVQAQIELYDKIIQEQSARIDDLTLNNQGLSEAKSTQEAKLKDLTGQLAELQRQVAALNQIKTDLATKSEMLEQVNAELREDFATIILENKAFLTKIVNLESSLATNKKLFNELKAKQDLLAAELEALKLEKASLQAELTSEKDSLQEEKATNDARIRAITERTEQITTENTELATRLVEISTENTTLTKQLDDIKTKNAGLTDQLAAITKENVTLAEQLAEITRERVELTEQLKLTKEDHDHKLQEQQNSKDLEIQSLTAHTTQLQEKLATTEQRLSEKFKQITGLTEDLAAKQAQMNEMGRSYQEWVRNNIHNLQTEQEKFRNEQILDEDREFSYLSNQFVAEKKIVELTSQTERQSKEIAVLTAQYSHILQQEEQYNTTITALKLDVAAFAQQLNQSQQQHESNVAAAKAEIASLQEKLVEATTSKDFEIAAQQDLQQKLTEIGLKYQALGELNLKLQTEQSSLEEKLERNIQEKAAIAASFNQLKSNMQTLEQQLAEIRQVLTLSQQEAGQHKENEQVLQHSLDQLGQVERDLASQLSQQVSISRRLEKTLNEKDFIIITIKDSLAEYQRKLTSNQEEFKKEQLQLQQELQRCKDLLTQTQQDKEDLQKDVAQYSDKVSAGWTKFNQEMQQDENFARENIFTEYNDSMGSIGTLFEQDQKILDLKFSLRDDLKKMQDQQAEFLEQQEQIAKKLQIKLAAKQVQLVQLEQSHAGLTFKYKQSQVNSTQHQERAENLAREVAQLTQQNKDLTANLGELRDKNDKLNQKCVVLNQKITDLDTKNQELSEELAKIATEKLKLTEDIDWNKQKLNGYAQQLDQKSVELSILQQKLAEAETTTGLIEAKLISVTQEMSTEQAASSSEIHGLRSELAKINSEKDRLEQERGDLLTAKAAIEQLQRAEQETLKDLTKKLNESQDKLTLKQQEINEIKQEFANCQDELRAMKQELISFNEKMLSRKFDALMESEKDSRELIVKDEEKNARSLKDQEKARILQGQHKISDKVVKYMQQQLSNGLKQKRKTTAPLQLLQDKSDVSGDRASAKATLPQQQEDNPKLQQVPGASNKLLQQKNVGSMAKMTTITLSDDLEKLLKELADANKLFGGLPAALVDFSQVSGAKELILGGLKLCLHKISRDHEEITKIIQVIQSKNDVDADIMKLKKYLSEIPSKLDDKYLHDLMQKQAKVLGIINRIRALLDTLITPQQLPLSHTLSYKSSPKSSSFEI